MVDDDDDDDQDGNFNEIFSFKLTMKKNNHQFE